MSEIILSRETQVSVYTIFLCFFPLASFLLSGCQTFLKSHQYKLRYFFTSYIYKCHLRVCYLLTRVERRFCDILHGESCAGIVPRWKMLRQYANPNPIYIYIYIYTIKYLPRVLRRFIALHWCIVVGSLLGCSWKSEKKKTTTKRIDILFFWYIGRIFKRSVFQDYTFGSHKGCTFGASHVSGVVVIRVCVYVLIKPPWQLMSTLTSEALSCMTSGIV